MQSFKTLCNEMLAEPAFRDLFEKECHICTNTMRIFARLDKQGLTPAELAMDLGVPALAVDNLATAEYCDPHLVVRICHHLDLPLPDECPRMSATQA